MKLFELSFDKLIIRFYVLMGIIIIAGFTGLWWLGMLALPVFFSALMGMSLSRKITIKQSQRSGSVDVRRYVEQGTAHS